MNKLKLTVLAALAALTISAQAQTNATTNTSTPNTIVGTLQSYLVVNDTNYNGWATYHADLWQAAVFQDVKGVAGASAVGNVLGLEVPVYRWSSNTYALHLESLTDFETVFGDIGWQGLGIGLDYNLHQVQVSFVMDLDIGLKGPTTATIAPGLEFKKASTSLAGVSPLARYDFPIRKNEGAGRVFVGVQFPF